MKTGWRRAALAAAAAAAPAWAVLLILVATGTLSAGAAVLGAMLATALAVPIVRPHLLDLAALAMLADDLAARAGTRPPRAARTALTAEIALALARARRRIAAAQRALEARAAGAEAIVHSVPEPLLVLDRRRQVVLANPAAEALLGSGLTGRDLVTVLRNPGILDAVTDTLRDGRSRTVDFELSLAVERAMRARIAPLPQWSDGSDAVIVALEDQTSIRRSEQMRVDFVANVSHELKTPLTALVGFIETLQGPARDDPEARERFLAIMQGQATRMRRIVEDLLSLSRIEAEEHNPPTAAVELEEMLRSVVEALERVAAEREMRIAVDCPSGLPPVAGDRDQLAQVFGNLLENAIKYSRPGTPVEITVRATAAAGRTPEQLAVEVRDYGEGIPSEHLPRLTERFYRVDAARSRNLGGTGLGLAIVKHIVSRHRGSLAIRSVEGQGSSFTVTLPVAAPRPETSAATVKKP